MIRLIFESEVLVKRSRPPKHISIKYRLLKQVGELTPFYGQNATHLTANISDQEIVASHDAIL